MTGSTVATIDGLRELVGHPHEIVVNKQLDRLDEHARTFIAASPLVIVASADADGRCDATPRGDPAGFVRVLDDRTLLLPDRKGNRRVDTMANVVSNPRLGLLFLVPGTNETLRVNGRARLTADEETLEESTVSGKRPIVGIVLEVEEVFFHCARAFLRGKVWDQTTWPERATLPTLGTILKDHAKIADVSAEEIDESLAHSNANLY